jgi:hypothetical protein
VGSSDGWAVAVDAPDAAKRAVASTICQALAKQWFGTLVSLAWWDTLYLVRTPLLVRTFLTCL